jgi:hypothetical protein
MADLHQQPSPGYTIGIDASRSVSAQPTGTELYSRYLTEAMLDRAPAHYAFQLYFNQAPQSAISNQQSAILSAPPPSKSSATLTSAISPGCGCSLAS